MTGTEVEIINAGALDPGSDEGVAWFDATMRQAQVLAGSGIVPQQYRGKPDDIVVASMYGRDFGWSPTMAMSHIHVVSGKPSLSAQSMTALVRAAGHSISGKKSNDSATATGTRKDTGDTMTSTFTVGDARTAGLLSNQTWKKYPASMCWARAVSQLCRDLFSDVLLGVSYTPEELEGIPELHNPAVSGSNTISAQNETVVSEVIEARVSPVPDQVAALRHQLGGMVRQFDADHLEHWKAYTSDRNWPDTQIDPQQLADGLDEAGRLLADQGVEPFPVDAVEIVEIEEAAVVEGSISLPVDDTEGVAVEPASQVPPPAVPATPKPAKKAKKASKAGSNPASKARGDLAQRNRPNT